MSVSGSGIALFPLFSFRGGNVQLIANGVILSLTAANTTTAGAVPQVVGQAASTTAVTFGAGGLVVCTFTRNFAHSVPRVSPLTACAYASCVPQRRAWRWPCVAMR